jgi:ABC-type multidrug transport system fused ATPase/permease subunit
VIKAFRAERHEQDGFARSSRRLFRRGIRAAVNRNVARALVDLLNKFAAGGVLLIGLVLVLRGSWGSRSAASALRRDHADAVRARCACSRAAGCA